MKREVGKEWWEKRGGKKGEIEDNNVSESGRGRGRKIRRKKGESEGKWMRGEELKGGGRKKCEKIK